MDRLIRSITTSITKQLPEDIPFFTPDDLRELDIPEFVVQRVEMEIYRNLNESFVPPHSEWADMSAGDVEHAWEQFIEAILEEVRLPASYANPVFETSVADVLEMILQPRTAVPEILFGPEKILTREELKKRLPFISVNSHLAYALLRFMDKKGHSKIDRETAQKVVEKVDTRITANYNSLNWAQLLQPLFLLAGPKVDTEMFRIFFKDRNMDRVSRRFDMLNTELNKTEFIETMSSPDLLNEEGYEEEQASLFELQGESGSEEAEHTAPGSSEGEKKETGETELQTETTQDSEKNSADQRIGEKENFSLATPGAPEGGEEELINADDDDDDEQAVDEDTLLGSFQSRLRKQHDQGYAEEDEPDEMISSRYETEEIDDGEDFDQESETDRPLYVRFDTDSEEDQEEGPTESEPEPESPETEPLGNKDEWPKLQDSDEWSESDAEDSSSETQENPDTEELEAEEYRDSEPDTEGDEPIWQSFLDDEEAIDEEDIPEFSPFADLEDDEVEVEDEPLIDLTVQPEEEDHPERLLGWLSDDEDRFKNAIFSGSYEAYEDSLVNLEKFENWKQASQYIEKEIFARNLVDMYDEEAVDFTDRLQTYFDEFKS